LAGTRKLTVEILGDAKGLSKELGDATTKLGSFGVSAAKVGAVGAAAFATLAVGVGSALYKIGESFDSAYDTIRVGTGETGKVLDMLKDDFRKVVSDVPTDFAKASTAISELHRRTGETGPTFQKLTEQMLELSRLTGTDLTKNIEATQDAFAAWGVEVKNQPKLLDELFVAGQRTGQSVESIAASIAKAQPQLKAIGLSFEDSAALAATLGQAGSALDDVMPALSKSLAKAAKDGKPAAKVFAETFAAIKNAPSDTAAAGKALDVFGAKAGPKLATMIRAGKLEYQDLLKQMQSGSDTILGAGKDTQDFGEKWQLIKNRVLVALEPVAMKVFDGVGKAMDRLGPVVARFSAWFSKELPVAVAYLQPRIQAFAALVSRNVPPVLERLRVVAVATFGWLRDNVPPVLDKIASFIRDKVIPAVKAFAGWINDNLVPALGKLWASFEENILPALAKVGSFIQTKVLPVLADIGEFIATKVLPVVGRLVTFIIGDLIPAFFEVVGWIADKVLPVLDNIASFIRDKVIPAVGDFAKAVGDIATTLAGWVVDVWRFGGQVLDFFRELPGKIGGFFLGLADTILAPFKAAFNAIADVWNNTVGSLSFTVPSWVPGLSGKGWDVPDIPKFDSGGTFRAPTAGGAGLALLRDGERVSVPRSSAGGAVIHLELGGSRFGTVVLSEVELAAARQGGMRVRALIA
jgi:TP901 family phage tail tape measure protein